MAAVLLPASLQSVRVSGISTPWVLALSVALLALHVCVATARRWPLPSFAIGLAGCSVLLVAPDIDGVTDFSESSRYSPVLLPSILCFFALLYAVSAHTAPPWPSVALGVGTTGSLLTLARLWEFTAAPIEAWAWWLLLSTTAFGGTIAAWALGRYRATRAAWTSQLAERAAADERRRIAREMHDVVAHSLAVMVGHAEAGRLIGPNSPEQATDILTTIADTGRGALAEMRGLLDVLRDESASTEPQPGLADLPALVDRVRASGVDVDLTMDDHLRATPTVGLTVFRVVQESLTNVTRHAGHRPRARVSLTAVDAGIAVLVTNTGPSTESAGNGKGLVGMRERVDAVGGTMSAGPIEDGWLVEVRVPC